MQNIIKFGLFMALCVSTSLWARSDQMSDQMPDQIYLGERLPKNQSYTILINQLKDNLGIDSAQAFAKLKVGQLFINDRPASVDRFADFDAFEADLIQNLGQEKKLILKFNGKEYKLVFNGDHYEITL